MANAVVNKKLDFLGVDNGEAQEDEEMLDNEYSYTYEPEDEAQDEEEDRGIFKRKNRVVNIAQQQIKMKIAKPTAFEQAEDICILLREKNAIVVNLEYALTGRDCILHQVGKEYAVILLRASSPQQV